MRSTDLAGVALRIRGIKIELEAEANLYDSTGSSHFGRVHNALDTAIANLDDAITVIEDAVPSLLEIERGNGRY